MKGIGYAVVMRPQKRAQESIHAINLIMQFYKDAFLLYKYVWLRLCRLVSLMGFFAL